jgi:hypothetical protein
MPNLITFCPSDQNSQFYGIMGPHFASLEHKKELGGWQVYNKLNSIWCLEFDDSKLIGFCVFFKKNSHYYLDNFVILKEFRNKKNSIFLMQNSLKDLKLKENSINIIRTITNNPIMQHILEKFNFKKIGDRGSYNVYEIRI